MKKILWTVIVIGGVGLGVNRCSAPEKRDRTPTSVEKSKKESKEDRKTRSKDLRHSGPASYYVE